MKCLAWLPFLHNSYFFYKKIIALRSRLILDRSVRHRWKHIQNYVLVNKLNKSYKWGVSYSVFDGEELLESSIKSIRESVDYINVVYQTKSWYGNPGNPKLLQLLESLKKQGLIDEIIEYTPDYSISAGKQERTKRNMGLCAAKRACVDYFMTMDTDEYYLKDQMEQAKRYIIKAGISHSFCPVVAYATPTRRSLKPIGGFVQFFSRVTIWSKLKFNVHNPALVDPTRQLNHVPFAKYFVLPKLEMHHMTAFRKDIDKKLKNSSFKWVNNTKGSDFVSGLDRTCIDVPNVFNIHV